MNLGFWGRLQKSIFALAPMANVTDAAFRRIIAKYSKPAGPDVLFTEFVSADGLVSVGREKLLVDLMYSESERPIVAQLFSGSPEKICEAAKLVKKLGFDGLDINMGCPDRSIEKSGAGAALMKNFQLAREIIRAAKEGVSDSPFPKGSGEYASRGISKSSVPTPSRDTSFRKGGIHTIAGSIPISIKTRLGYSKDILEEWLPELLSEEPSVITIHARTRKEMSRVPAHWDRIKRAVEIRDAFFSSSPPFQGGDNRGGGKKTLILGNGDVMSIAEAREKATETGADGIMLGRAIFGNPWLFKSDLNKLFKSGLNTRCKLLIEHARLFEQLFKGGKSFSVMKKHFKAYIEGFAGAKELRMKLMETENAEQVEKIIADYLTPQ